MHDKSFRKSAMTTSSTANIFPFSSETEEDGPVKYSKKQVRWWMFLAIASSVVAVVTTSLLIWQTAKYMCTVEKQNCPNNVTRTTNEFDNGSSKHDSSGMSPCPRLPTLSPLPTPLPAELKLVFNYLDSILTEMVDKDTSLPAISANIFFRDTVLWSAHRGSKIIKNNDRPDGNTVYRIGSVTKIFTVLLVYKLYEDGLIGSLDDPLKKYIPEFSIRNPFTKDDITLRQIVSQMSGLPREAPCIYHCEGTNSTKQLSLLINRSLILAPWTMPSYSNLGYALLGRLLTERVLNTTFERWIQDEILVPLEMNNTGFQITSAVENNTAFPYGNDKKQMPFMNIGWANPAGGMYSTVNDLIKLGMLFIRPSNQNVFKASVVREMALPVDIAPDGRTLWGSPFEMVFTNGFLVRGKTGNIDSFDAYFSFAPQLELGINVFISALHFVQSNVTLGSTFAQKAYDRLLPFINRTLFEMQKSADFPVPLKAFTGWFYVEQTNHVTLTKFSYNATVVQSNATLLFDGQSTQSFPFVIRYIGDSLTFQAEYLDVTMSCFNERGGIFADLFFSPPHEDGLSHGFTVPQWSVVARRIKDRAAVM